MDHHCGYVHQRERERDSQRREALLSNCLPLISETLFTKQRRFIHNYLDCQSSEQVHTTTSRKSITLDKSISPISCTHTHMNTCTHVHKLFIYLSVYYTQPIMASIIIIIIMLFEIIFENWSVNERTCSRAISTHIYTYLYVSINI